MFCSLSHFCARCVCGRRARQLQVWRNTGANCFLPVLNSGCFVFLSCYVLCDTGDGTGGGGKRLCEPESHILLSRSHDSLLIYSPLRLFFLLFFPVSIWLQPYEGSVCSPSEGNKDASVRASSRDGNIDRSFDPTCCTLTCMTNKTNVLIIIFFVCSDKKHKATFSLASHWFSHSLSFYFPTFITFEVTNLIVLTLSILTVGRLRICKLMLMQKLLQVTTCLHLHRGIRTK